MGNQPSLPGEELSDIGLGGSFTAQVNSPLEQHFNFTEASE